MAIFKHIFKRKGREQRTGCTSRQDVRRLIDYILRESAHGNLVYNDFEGSTPPEITDEIMALDRHRTPYLAYHFMFSFPEYEQETWRAHLVPILEDFKSRFGVFKLVAADHRDKGNYHIHIAVFAQTKLGKRLRLETHEDGKCIAIAASLRRLAEDWEDRLGATTTGRGQSPGMNVSKDELEMAVREHAQGISLTPIPAKVQLKADVERLVLLSANFSELETHALVMGIEVRLKKDETGNVLGISFARDGVALRGKDAGHTYAALSKRFYEQTQTPGRSGPPQCMAGPHRQSNYREHTTRSRRTKHALEGAESAYPITNRTATEHGRANGGLIGETEALIRLLTGGRPPTGVLQWISILLASMTQTHGGPKRNNPKIPL